MKRTTRVLPAVLVLLAAGALLWAEPAPPSNTGNVSGGLFREDQDNYLSVFDYPDIASPTLFLQFGMPTGLGGGEFSGGLGYPLGAIYLGGYFAGSNFITGMLSITGGNFAAVLIVASDVGDQA